MRVRGTLRWCPVKLNPRPVCGSCQRFCAKPYKRAGDWFIMMATARRNLSAPARHRAVRATSENRLACETAYHPQFGTNAPKPFSPIRGDVELCVSQHEKMRRKLARRDPVRDFRTEADERVLLAVRDPGRGISTGSVKASRAGISLSVNFVIVPASIVIALDPLQRPSKSVPLPNRSRAGFSSETTNDRARRFISAISGAVSPSKQCPPVPTKLYQISIPSARTVGRLKPAAARLKSRRGKSASISARCAPNHPGPLRRPGHVLCRQLEGRAASPNRPSSTPNAVARPLPSEAPGAQL